MSGLTTCAGCGAPINDATDDDSSKQLPCSACGSTKRNIIVTPGTIQINLSPFAFQRYAKDFYEAYKKVKGGATFSPARLTLLAQAVELAAKSMHVHQGKTDDHLRSIRHDLVRACNRDTLAKYGITLNASEASELQKLSDLNKAKAFEYFWFLPPGTERDKANPDQSRVAGLTHAVTGRKGLPDESIVEGLLVKLLEPTM